jgi:hypothetical protein
VRRQFDVEIAFGTFSVVVVGAAAAAAPSPYRALSGRNVVETTSTPECIRRSSFRRSEAQNVSKETNILLYFVLFCCFESTNAQTDHFFFSLCSNRTSNQKKKS